MEGYSTEEETLAALSNWWKKNGRYILAGLVLAALVIGGWRLWGYWQAQREATASSLYAAVIQAEQKSDVKAITKAARKVVKAYPDSAYGALAGLALAKAELTQELYDESASTLKRVIEHSPDKGLAAVARLRLARVQLQLKKPQDALDTLRPLESLTGFAAAVDNLRGDALAALGRQDQARQAYGRALAASDPTSGLHRLLQMRLASLPLATTVPGAVGAAPAATAGAVAPASPGRPATGGAH